MLAGCGGATAAFPAASNGRASTELAAAANKITIAPAKIALAKGASTSVVVSENGVPTKLFTSESTGKRACKRIASWSPKRGKGPDLEVRVHGVKIGLCTIIFSDGRHSARASISVLMPATSPSPSPTSSSTPTASPTPTSVPTPFHIPGTLYVTTLEGSGYEGTGNIEEFIGAMSDGGPGPWATISGSATEIGNPAGIGVDAMGRRLCSYGREQR